MPVDDQMDIYHVPALLLRRNGCQQQMRFFQLNVCVTSASWLTFFHGFARMCERKRGKKTLDFLFFPIIKLCLGDDVLAVCGPGEVFIALLESCCAALIAEIMGENGTQRTVLMTPTRQENSEDK